MKKLLFLIAASLLVFSCKTGSVKIKTSQGDLIVTPLTDNSVRVVMKGEPTHNVEELIFTEKVQTPAFKKTEDASSITIELAQMKAFYDKTSETLAYYGKDGNLLFKEQPGTRVLKKTTVGGVPVPATSTGTAKLTQPDPIQGDPTYFTSQTFVMQEGDHQYGTGQYQDGFLDIMGLTHRLVQLNTQTSIPVIISSKGYGILWHNYGETFFNKPTLTKVLNPLPQENPAPSPVPGMRAMPAPKIFAGEFSIDKAGKYCLYVYGGDHVARGGHKIIVDDQVVFEDSDGWVTAVSAFANLAPGTHTVQYQGSSEDSVEFGWRAVDQTTTFSSPVSQNLDYTVFAGNADQVISTYRTLTGPIPELPDWVFGYIHCRERYDTQAELLENAREFHRRGIPVSCIVQDWQWWGKTGWNSMVFDKDKYPDPKAMVDEVHDLGMKLMISVWSRVETGSVLGDNLTEKGYFIPGTEWVDYFNPEAAEYYWESFRDSLVKVGFDAWWFDSTEPDNDYELMNRRVANNTIPGNVYRNVYPLLVNRTMYEGFKKYDPDNMPLVLTRSAFAGAQRYGIFTWSGDVGHDWTTFKRQIIGGLGQMAAGLPWWTYDAGGFSRPRDQYTSQEYQERMLRWIQTSVFLPMMRVHGSGSHTEPWNYSDETYRIFVDCINLRYKLMPYILENAKKVSEEGYTLMRPLVFDFADDAQALEQDCEFMFGPDYLVCPITEPGVTTWRVYLPKNEAGWEEFRSGVRYPGGQYIDCPVDLEFIPVFKRL